MGSGDGSDWIAADAPEIDSVALWLLRLGIDSRGQLTPGPLWDIAVRVGVLVDLRVSGRIVDSDTTTYIDEPTAEGAYEDAVCDQLLHGGFDSETSWLDRGRLRVRDVAPRLVETDGWRSKAALFQPGGRAYRAPTDRYPALREHLRSVVRGAPARAPHEFVTALLADQLFSLAGGTGELELRWDECGPYRDLVTHASIRIRTRAAMAQLGASGGGG